MTSVSTATSGTRPIECRALDPMDQRVRSIRPSYNDLLEKWAPILPWGDNFAASSPKALYFLKTVVTNMTVELAEVFVSERR